MARTPGTAAVVRRILSTAPLLSLFVVIVVALLSALGAVTPALLHEARDATLREQFQRLPVALRSPSAAQSGFPTLDASGAGPHGVWGSALALAAAAREKQPEPLRDLLGAPRLAVGFPAKAGRPLPSDAAAPTETIPLNKVAVLVDEGLADRIRVVDGALPEADPPDPAPAENSRWSPPPPGGSREKEVQVALSRTSADALVWRVGESRVAGDLTLRLTGVFEPTDAADPDWAFLDASLEPMIEVDNQGNIILRASVFTARDQIAALTAYQTEARLLSWMPLDTAALDADEAPRIAQQLRRLAAEPANVVENADVFFNTGLLYQSAAPEAIDEGGARGRAMTAVVAIAAVGPIAVAVVVLVLAARMLALRRRSTVLLSRARGASATWLAVLFGAEGLGLGVLGAGAGVATAFLLGKGEGAASLLVPALLAAVPAIAVPLSALAGTSARPGRNDLGESGARSGRWRRIAAETFLLVATAGLSAILLARGTTSNGSDPLLLVLPVLLGASGAVLALRVLPPLLGLLERRGTGSAGLLPLLGPARARRDPSVRAAPVLAVVVGIGVAVFSVAFAATISSGIVQTARVTTGADLRVDASGVEQKYVDRIAALPGVSGVAPLYGDEQGEAKAGVRSQRIRIYVVDAAGFAAVQHGAPWALPLPSALAGTGGDRVPVVASAALVDALGTTAFQVDGEDVDVVATTGQAVPFGTAERWIIVDRENAQRVGVRSQSISTILLSLDPGTGTAATADGVRGILGAKTPIAVPSEVIAVHAADPALAAVRAALLLACGLVAVLLGIAVAQTLVLGATARGRLLAILRTAGFGRRGQLPLVAWEVAPALLVAVPFGALAGLAMSWLLIGGIDLRGFVGGQAQPALDLGGAWQAVVIGGFLVAAAVAVGLATAIAARIRSAETIRMGDEDS